MEMTVRRTAGLAVAAFALLLLARPPRPTGLVYAEVQQRRMSPADRAKSARTATLDSLLMVDYAIWSRRLRDSVERQLVAVPPAGRNRIVLDPRMPASVRSHMTEVYAASRVRMAGGAALPLFVVLDTARSYRLGTTLWIEHAQGGVTSCATLVRVRITNEALADERRRGREIHRVLGGNFPQPKHFGLCGFEAAFGSPSPAMRDWLRAREYQPVASGYDPSQPPRLRPRWFRDNFIPYWNTANNAALALSMRACAAGRVGQCVDAVAPASERPLTGAEEAPSDVRWYGWSWRGSPDVMNTLAAGMGAERFAALWQGEDPPTNAYRRLTGVPIDTLARRVLLGTTSPVPAGASVSLGEAIVLLLVAAMFAGLATLSHPRRRT